MATRPVTFDSASLRASYAAAGTAFVELAGRVPDDAWNTTGLGEWTVRDLVGHTTRSFVTVTEYLAGGEGRPIELEHAFDYARVFRLAHANAAAITDGATCPSGVVGPCGPITSSAWVTQDGPIEPTDCKPTEYDSEGNVIGITCESSRHPAG